jgi:hypothetical protein
MSNYAEVWSAMISKKIILSLYIFSLFFNLSCAELIQGDNDAPEGATFSFGIGPSIMSGFSNFYVGSNTPLTNNKNFALSRLNRGNRAFQPIAPEKVVFNAEVDQENPLFGQKIIALSLLKPIEGMESPVAVAHDDPNIVYLVENSFNNAQINIASAGPLHDAAGNISDGIIALETNVLSHVFATVNPSVGTFGDPGSGIALMIRGDVNNEKRFIEVDAQTGNIVAKPKAFPLDKNSTFVTMNTQELDAMGNSVVMHWDSFLQRFFIGMNVTSNNNSNDGALAIVVGQIIKDGGLNLYAIAPDSAFDQNNMNNIIGVRAANQPVTINSITTLYTSTALNYLIIAGNVGDSDNAQQSVFAIPLVNNGDFTGMLADKNQEPIDEFQDGDIPRLSARVMRKVATTQNEMTQSDENAALVGGRLLDAGIIKNLVVRDDTVFALVVADDSFDERLSGVYSSQALYSASGKIKGWTQWQRATGTTDPIYDGALNVFDGRFILATGNSETSVNTVSETIWSSGSKNGFLPVTTYLNSIFNPNNGGIQSLQTFLPSTPGLADIAMMTVGGIGTIVLIQTGLLDNNVLVPTLSEEFDDIKTYSNGTITDQFTDAKIVTISGGDLDNVGPITATEIGSTEIDGWLFVGGSNGLAVLAQPDGTGWSIEQNELGDEFDGLTRGMRFKTIGDYRFVKKLICDEEFLYIITHDRIDRIDLNNANFATGNLNAVTVATQESLGIISPNGSILDCIISQSCALVATSGGIARTANNTDIRTISSSTDNNWTPILIPETSGAPTQLLCVTQTSREQDFTRGVGGQVYVLTSNEGYDQSRINRFSLSPLSNGEAITDTTIKQFNDLFVQNIPSFFINFGNFNSIFATDGALYFASRSKHNALPPQTVLTPGYPAPQVSARNVGERSTPVAIFMHNATEINALQRSQASGSWVIAGDFGMQVLE